MKTKDGEINGVFYIILILLAAAIAISPLLFIRGCGAPVQAAGYTELTINSDAHKYLDSSYSVWTTATHQDTAISAGNNLCAVGYGAASSTPNYYRTRSSILRFNLDTAPDISLVNGIKVRLYFVEAQVTNDPDFQGPYVSLYDCNTVVSNGTDSAVIDNFNDEQKRNRLTNYYYWTDFSDGNWYEFTVTQSDWPTVLNKRDSHYSYMSLVTEQHALDNIPTGVWSASGSYTLYFGAIAGANPAIYPQLVISYAEEATPPVFDYHENALVDNVTSGDEVASNITLSTLSCMYANENLEFDIQGESGAVLDLELISSSGAVLDSIADSVRTNSHYYWQIDSLAENYSGFIRARENTYNLLSPWVCVQPAVDSSQANLNIYAVNTEYPQYAKPFSTYVVNRGGVMYVHWKTNIDTSSDNMTDLRLEIYNNGDNVTSVYSKTFETLSSDYYKGTDNNTYTGLSWRFAVFTPKTTTDQNTYGGLIQNLGLDFVPDNKGYLQPMINSDADGEITTTHSAYWYLESASEGIGVSLLDSTLAVGQEIGVNVKVGRECNVENYLRYVTVSVVGTSSSTSTFVVEGDNELYIDALNAAGDYTLQIDLYDESITSYHYIYQIEFSVTESGAPSPTDGPVTSSDIWDWITDIMERWHLNTTGGHWLLILIGMGAMMIIGHVTGHKTIGLAGALLVFALGIVVGWIDWWWVVLLALGAGFTVWQFIRSKAAGGGDG